MAIISTLSPSKSEAIKSAFFSIKAFQEKNPKKLHEYVDFQLHQKMGKLLLNNLN